MTSSVLQNEPHRCCSTSLIVSTYQQESRNEAVLCKKSAYTDLLPNLLVNYHVYQGSRNCHASLGCDKIFKCQRRNHFLNFGIAAEVKAQINVPVIFGQTYRGISSARR
jgi:hypothetical protein